MRKRRETERGGRGKRERDIERGIREGGGEGEESVREIKGGDGER